MEADSKTLAETQRQLLAEDVVPLGAMQTWADEQIAAMSEPPYWLIAVSMAKSTEDALSALADVPGTANGLFVWTALTRAWREILGQQPERDSEIAKHLYFIGMQGRSPIPGIDGDLMSFWDAIDLARDGTYGSLEAERKRLRVFLERWA